MSFSGDLWKKCFENKVGRTKHYEVGRSMLWGATGWNAQSTILKDPKSLRRSVVPNGKSESPQLEVTEGALSGGDYT